MVSSAKLMLAVVGSVLLAQTALAYPGLFRPSAAVPGKPSFSECQQHPTTGNSVHRGAIQADTGLSYKLVTSGKTMTKACPGVAYTVQMSFRTPRRCLVTTSKGTLIPNPSNSNTCVNRWWMSGGGMAAAPVLRTACTATGTVAVRTTCSMGPLLPFMQSTLNIPLLPKTAPECRALPAYPCK